MVAAAGDGGMEGGAEAQRPSPRAPLGELLPALGVIAPFAAASVTWTVAGDALPGGRWLAVHLFTVGVLSTAVIALTHHFAQTVFHAAGRSARRGRIALVGAGAVLFTIGLPAGVLPVFAGGATLLTVAVLWLHRDLHHLRRASLGARFGFVVRAYEQACGAFTLGALLGILMALVPLGAWYGGARLAHLHAAVLGWGGLTLLATLVFFGPTVMRVKMETGADAAAARALPRAATSLSFATVALLCTGIGGELSVVARLGAAAALAAFAWQATVVCTPVLRTGARARGSLAAWHLRASCVWFVLAVWTDVAVVATGALRFLDAVGAAALIGVLGQAVLASLAYLLPMVVGRGAGARAGIRQRLEWLPRSRALALNGGVALAVAATVTGGAAGAVGSVIGQVGWALIGAVVVGHLALMTVVTAVTVVTPDGPPGTT